MAIRTQFIIVLVLLSAALIACAVIARRSKRPMSFDVFLVLVALLPPVVGNSLIIVSDNWLVSNVGCYLYYLGMDLVVAAVLRFTTNYCSVKYRGTPRQAIALALIAIDMIQLLINPITGHAFTTTQIMVDGAPYYKLVPLAGQVFHRIIAYGVYAVSLLVFVYKTITAPRIYVERYLVILLSMIFVGAWQSYYIFSGTPIDRSMIGFTIFGLLIFYFALYYRPLRLLDKMLAQVVSDMNEGVLFFDRDGTCIYANEASSIMFGLPVGAEESEVTAAVVKVVGEETFSTESQWACKRSMESGGEKRYLVFNFHALLDKKQRKVGSFLTVRDRTEEEMKIRREKHLATHDRLTGLYNTRRLYEKTQSLLEDSPEKRYYVIGIDIKNFKLINDIFNREFGDRVLCWVANAIAENSPQGSVYGRLSADRFGIVVSAEEFDAKAVSGFISNLTYHDNETGLTHSIVLHLGVYETNDEDIPASIMFDRAFMALSTIKNDYQQHVAFYDKVMREDVLWRQSISAELDEAIEQGQIRPYLQPMVNENGHFMGAEVLVRWIHPTEGFLSPARFIPVFEDNGMIARLDEYMWECACRILKDWEARGIDLFLSVNISPKDFYFIDVVETIRELVTRYEVNPRKLRLEITETVMMNDIEKRLQIIDDLRADGFLVEMDDFGSGYSSLNMLKDIPVDVLKIDMMFLYQTKDAERARTILQTIINLSGQLGIPSVTEGVETQDQLAMLVQMGCRLFQGYYFAKPMPLSEFEETFEKVIAC